MDSRGVCAHSASTTSAKCRLPGPATRRWAGRPARVRPTSPRRSAIGVEHILYTRLEVENGAFTGRVIEPICFEEGKIYWLQQFIEQQRIDLAMSYFYTDSITDLPLLDIVGYG